MAFDWPNFLNRYNISSEPARRGWIDVICPWCSPAVHHLGINCRTGIYNCWHGELHKGKAPARLVQALLGCSRELALQIVGSHSDSFVTGDATFADDALARLGLRSERTYTRAAPASLDLLPEFGPIKDAGLCGRFAMPYLGKRGYSSNDAIHLSERYGLRFASRGPFAYRIIVPVEMSGRLVNWTGRTVAESDELRYKSMTTDPESAERQGLPPAPMNIKHALFDYDQLKRGGDVLVITEGPFDALRVGFLGERRDIKATCLFGKAATEEQVELIADLAPRFRSTLVLLDQDSSLGGFLVFPDYLGVRQAYLPRGAKDPAELSARQFEEVVR